MISKSLDRSHLQPVQWDSTSFIGTYWNRIVLSAVMLLAVALNFFGLTSAGYGNTYYAAAVKSMGENWHAFFFNSLDSAGFVSIDKPPLGFWLQVASTKILGFNGFALILPQALAGVLSVAVLYYLVSLTFGKPAGLLAALVLAVTPISVVADRNNIIDSTLVLAVLLGAWAVTRATSSGKLRWLLFCALCIGLGFNIKMLEAYLVVPAFGLMYLLGARIGWGRRAVYLSIAALVLLVTSLSWATVVDLTPASQRPWVGSTTTNSELDLALGYNGLQRLTGNVFQRGGGRTAPRRATNLSPGAPGGFTAGETGQAGPLRLLNSQLGGQIGWLLPLAVIGFLAALWQTRSRRRFDEQQAALVLWGAWLATTGVFFSVAGFFHTYYLVMMAPAIAALSGIGLVSLWRLYCESKWGWWLLPASLIVVAGVEAHLLTDYPAWARWLVPTTLALCILAILALLLARFFPRLGAAGALAAVVLGVVGLLSAPAAWAADSVSSGASGLLPRAGPAADAGNGGPGGFSSRGRTFSFGGRAGAVPLPAGGFGPPIGRVPLGAFGRGGRGFGGTDGVNKGLVRYLEKHQAGATYLVAAANAGTAESYILATGKAVMAMGGFLGSDPILTPSRLASLVKQGAIRYFLLPSGGDLQLSTATLTRLPARIRNQLGRRGSFGGRFGENSAVTVWVQKTCRIVPSKLYSTAAPRVGGLGGGERLYECGTGSH